MREKRSERGATILESLMCILLLCMIFFGLMQIFQWSMAQMLTEYSSFYSAKAQSLGYSRAIVERASRIAITGASGEDVSAIPTVAPFTQSNLATAAEEYMSYGRYGSRSINFEYWEPDNVTSDTPIIDINYPDTGGSTINSRVMVKNMPLLTENISWLFGGATEANPSGEASTFNHASLYLENN